MFWLNLHFGRGNRFHWRLVSYLGPLSDQYLGLGVIQCSVLLKMLLASVMVEIVLWIGSWLVKSLSHWPLRCLVWVCFSSEKCRSQDVHLALSPVRWECDHIFSSDHTNRTLGAKSYARKAGVHCCSGIWQCSNTRRALWSSYINIKCWETLCSCSIKSANIFMPSGKEQKIRFSWWHLFSTMYMFCSTVCGLKTD